MIHKTNYLIGDSLQHQVNAAALVAINLPITIDVAKSEGIVVNADTVRGHDLELAALMTIHHGCIQWHNVTAVVIRRILPAKLFTIRVRVKCLIGGSIKQAPILIIKVLHR